MEKKYRAADVLFALRQEYIEIGKKLYLLSCLTDFSKNKNLIGVNYRVEHEKEGYSNNEARLIGELIQNPKTLLGVIDYLKKEVFDTYNYGSNRVYVTDTVSGKYVLTYDDFVPVSGRYAASIPERSQEMYGNIAREILTSELFKVENQRELYSEGEEGKLLLEVEQPKLYAGDGYCFGFSGETYDKAYAHGEGELVSETIKALNMTFYGDELTEYQKSLIEKSGIQDKKIYIPSTEPALVEANFDVHENEGSIILIKKWGLHM